MKIYEKLYFIYLLCDVCIFLVFLIRIFEREDVDLFMIEFRVLVIIRILRKMKEKDVFLISWVVFVVENLGIEIKEDNLYVI